jgi:hypothetical protein
LDGLKGATSTASALDFAGLISLTVPDAGLVLFFSAFFLFLSFDWLWLASVCAFFSSPAPANRDAPDTDLPDIWPI